MFMSVNPSLQRSDHSKISVRMIANFWPNEIITLLNVFVNFNSRIRYIELAVAK